MPKGGPEVGDILVKVLLEASSWNGKGVIPRSVPETTSFPHDLLSADAMLAEQVRLNRAAMLDSLNPDGAVALLMELSSRGVLKERRLRRVYSPLAVGLVCQALLGEVEPNYGLRITLAGMDYMDYIKRLSNLSAGQEEPVG